MEQTNDYDYVERKRWLFLGLPWTFTVYRMKDDMLNVKTGFFRLEQNDCYMYKIVDVRLTQTLMVQVKHKPDTAIGASEVRALSGILKAGDIALFVTSGTYSADARNAASGNDKFIRLIDGNDFIDMWQEYYDKMTDDDKNMLPLKRIAFLGNNE